MESLLQMPSKAVAFIACTAVAGLTILSVGAFLWSSSSTPRFFVYLLLTLIASTLKVRLPGISSTISASFLFVLIGIAEFSLSETLVACCCAALMQTIWRTKRYMPEQVIFNVASWAISIALSHYLSHFILRHTQGVPLTILLVLAALLFFGIHTGLIALVVSLTTHKSFADIWHECFLWSFPYYIVGAIIASLFCMSTRAVGWNVSVLVLPLMYLSYMFYRSCVQRLAGTNAIAHG